MTPRRLVSRILPLLLAGLLVCPAVPASPSAPPAIVPSRTAPTLVDHLRREIRSSDSVRREYALMDVVRIANCTGTCSIRLRSFPGKTIHVHNDADFGNVLDVSGLVPDLLWVYRQGPTDALRRMALAGLLHIGDEASLEYLLTSTPSVSPTVQDETHRLIAHFFIAKYPSLKETVQRTRVLSLTDVHRARLRKKRARRHARLDDPSPPPRKR